VINGFNGPVEVSGQQFPGAVMTPFGEILKDEDIAAVLTFIRQEWGNKASAVTTEQAKKVREATKGRDTNWQADELKNIPDKD
jgi:mono/diheme cytochrome c family protein